MQIFFVLYQELLYKPIFNLLVFFYNAIPGNDFGIAIILITLLIRFVFYPLTHKVLKSQKKLSLLQPKIKEIQEKYKDNREKQTKEIFNLYKEHNVNPFSGCLSILVQLPILIALYQVFLKGFDPSSLDNLYGFVRNPGLIDPIFLGIVDLSKRSILFALLTGVAQFIQSKLSFAHQEKHLDGGALSAKLDISAMMGKQMMYFFPVFTVFITWNLPAGVVLYWLITTIFSVFQQLHVNRLHKE